MVRKSKYINVDIIVKDDEFGVVDPVVYLGPDDGEYIEQIRELIVKYLEDPNVRRVVDSTIRTYE